MLMNWWEHLNILHLHILVSWFLYGNIPIPDTTTKTKQIKTDKNATIAKPHWTYSQRINRGGTPWFTWKEETFFISLDLSHASRLNCEPSLLCHCLPTPWRPWARDTESIHRNKQTGSKLIFTQSLKTCKIKVKKIWRGYWKRKKKPAIWGHKILLSEYRNLTF